MVCVPAENYVLTNKTCYPGTYYPGCNVYHCALVLARGSVLCTACLGRTRYMHLKLLLNFYFSSFIILWCNVKERALTLSTTASLPPCWTSPPKLRPRDSRQSSQPCPQPWNSIVTGSITIGCQFDIDVNWDSSSCVSIQSRHNLPIEESANI